MASFLDLPGASDNLLNPIFQKYCINAIFNFIDKNEELPGPLGRGGGIDDELMVQAGGV